MSDRSDLLKPILSELNRRPRSTSGLARTLEVSEDRVRDAVRALRGDGRVTSHRRADGTRIHAVRPARVTTPGTVHRETVRQPARVTTPGSVHRETTRRPARVTTPGAVSRGAIRHPSEARTAATVAHIHSLAERLRSAR